MVKRESVVRIPPNKLGEDMEKVVTELAQATFEGRIEVEDAVTVLVTNIERLENGRIVHGDGGVYQQVRYDALIFRPELQEVVLGTVCDVLKFGVFIRFGPLDGLLHISQIMDDRIDIDENNRRLIGKDTKRDLRIGDQVKVRIVSASLDERSPRESKIGLTMRQQGLGKLEWIEDERKRKEKVEKEGKEWKGKEEKKKGAK